MTWCIKLNSVKNSQIMCEIYELFIKLIKNFVIWVKRTSFGNIIVGVQKLIISNRNFFNYIFENL